jgi:hypothetical protein
MADSGMTDDELKVRIERMYAAIGATIEREMYVGGGTKVEGELRKLEGGGINFKFGGKLTDSQLANLAWNAIHNLAIFFEYCKEWGKHNGVAYQEIANVRDNAREIRIIEDLHNSEKHPAQRANQSGVSPKLTDLRQVLRVQGGVELVFEGPGGLTARGKDVSLVVYGAILNSKTGTLVGDLHDVIDEALQAWEQFLRTKGLVDAAGTPALSGRH